jgi:molecular chaperone DnaK
LQLPLSDMGANHFRAVVFDPAGRPVPSAGQEWTIERALAASAGIPATQTIGMKVQDDGGRNTIAPVVEKGALLPQTGIARFRAAQLLRAGGHGVLRLELFQVSDPAVLDPALNLAIGEFRIRGTDLPEGLSVRRGTELVVHWAMNEGQTIKAEVEIPDLGQTFDEANFYDWQAALHSFEGEDGAKLASVMLDGAEEELDETASVLPLAARTTIPVLRARLDAARRATDETAEPDARRGAAEEARLVRQAVAALCSRPEVRTALLRRELNAQLRFFDRDIRPEAPPAVVARADQLASSVRAELEGGTADGFTVADSLIREINALYWGEGLRLPSFCAMYWRWVRVERHLMRDKDQFDTALEAGDRQLAAGDMEGQRASLRAVWNNKIASGRREDVSSPADVLRE